MIQDVGLSIVCPHQIMEHGVYCLPGAADLWFWVHFHVSGLNRVAKYTEIYLSRLFFQG